MFNHITNVLNGAPDFLLGIEKGNPVLVPANASFTWHNRPSAAELGAGASIRISDYGPSGSTWVSDGTNWRPLNGFVVLWRKLGSLATPVHTLTGTGAAQSFTLPDNTTLPAGMLIPGVSRLGVMARTRRVGAGGASASVQIRMGNSGSGGIADNSIVAQTVAATTLTDVYMDAVADVTTTTSFTNTGFLGRNGAPNTSSYADRTTNFDCSGSNTNLVSIGVSSAFTVDQMVLLGYEITLLG